MRFLGASAAALISKADRARDRRDWVSAAAAYRRALRRRPKLVAIWVQYGHALKEQGGLAEAERAYCRSIALAGQVADTHLQLGHALKLQCRIEEAEEAYLRALGLDPHLVDAREELVRFGWSTTRIEQRLAAAGTVPQGGMAQQCPARHPAITIDASDLFYHFLDRGAIASGIQRVQLNLIGELLSLSGAAIEVAIKNHAFAFTAWRRMIEERGIDHTPLLVCVGRRGWLFDEGDQALRSDRRLQQRIRVLADVSDAELGELYRKALFTIYPSLCEGWGLPVSEALGHGRVPLVANIPALREAGGDYADYFDPADAADFDSQLRRLLDDHCYRASCEALIKRGYRPRSWREITGDAVQAITDWQQAPPQSAGNPGIAPPAPMLVAGVYLPLTRNQATDLPGLVRDGARYRVGLGWDVPDRSGCAMRGTNSELRIRVADPHACARLLYLHLENPADEEVRLRIETAAGGGGEWIGSLAAHSRRCIPIMICPERDGDHAIAVVAEPAGPAAFGERQISADAPLRLLGLYLCGDADEPSRNKFLECVARDELASLTCPVGRMPPSESRSCG